MGRHRTAGAVLGKGGEGVEISIPISYGVLGVLWALPAGFRAQPRPLEGFPLFSVIRMDSTDTIILLIVDYHAAIGGGGKTPMPPLRMSMSMSTVDLYSASPRPPLMRYMQSVFSE